MKCSACGSRDIDFHESGGHSFCVSCGNLVEENTIVSSIEFQENGDRSQVIGQFVAANCSRPYSSGGRAKGRFGSGRDSRDATIFKMRQIIMQISNSLSMPDDGIVDRALGLYQLAMEKNFVFGRRQIHVASTCLYAICRREQKPHLLIDFSDALQVNIYILGKSFLQFIRLLNLKLPVIDPSLYIHRFAQRLALQDQTNSVIIIALRIITRLKKDWIVMGRRPDGICAAAMLIASRAHGFPHSQAEMVKIFHVSSDTIKQRLNEFKYTPSAQLTVSQFYHHDSSVEYDPPSYTKNILKEQQGQSEIQVLFSVSDNPTESVLLQRSSSSSSSSSSSATIAAPLPYQYSQQFPGHADLDATSSEYFTHSLREQLEEDITLLQRRGVPVTHAAPGAPRQHLSDAILQPNYRDPSYTHTLNGDTDDAEAGSELQAEGYQLTSTYYSNDENSVRQPAPYEHHLQLPQKMTMTIGDVDITVPLPMPARRYVMPLLPLLSLLFDVIMQLPLLLQALLTTDRVMCWLFWPYLFIY